MASCIYIMYGNSKALTHTLSLRDTVLLTVWIKKTIFEINFGKVSICIYTVTQYSVSLNYQ